MECEKARKASVMAAREAAKRRKRLRTSSNSSNGSGGSASTSTSSSSTPGKARRLLMDMPLPASASQGIRRPSASRSSSQRSQGSQRGRSKSLERLRLQAALRGNNYQGYRVVLSAQIKTSKCKVCISIIFLGGDQISKLLVGNFEIRSLLKYVVTKIIDFLYLLQRCEITK